MLSLRLANEEIKNKQYLSNVYPVSVDKRKLKPMTLAPHILPNAILLHLLPSAHQLGRTQHHPAGVTIPWLLFRVYTLDDYHQS